MGTIGLFLAYDRGSEKELQKAQISEMSDAQQRSLLAKLLLEKSKVGSSFPMSAGQQGLWHAYRRCPESTAFNVYLPTRILGPLNPQLLRQSIDWIARRHSALRTTFSDDGDVLSQVVHRELLPEFEVDSTQGALECQVREKVAEQIRRPFCLKNGPLLRVIVYRLAENDWVVLAVTHHIIVDFWSLIIILSELRAVYPALTSGRDPRLPSAADNYHEFVRHQQSLLASDAGASLAEYWSKELQDISPVLEIPTDFARPTAFSQRAGSEGISITKETTRRVVRLATELRSTPFAVVHSALQVFLQRTSRQQSFMIGSPFSGRSNHKYEQTVGFFINMLPIKACPTIDQSFSQLVRLTTNRLMEALDHEAMPISEIVRKNAVARDSSRSPLFQVSCTFERAQKKEELGRAGLLFPDQTKVFEFAGMRQESFYVPHPTCHYDLEFIFEHSEDGLSAMLIYCRDLFESSSMRQLSTNFSDLLECLLQHAESPLGSVPWRSSEQWKTHKPIRDSSDELPVKSTGGVASITSVDHWIGIAAERFPKQSALEWTQNRISYGEMLQLAQKLSHQLVDSSLAEDRFIPVLCHHGPHAFVAMLAVHLSQGVAVPVDMSQPSVSVGRILDDLKGDSLLTDCSEIEGALAKNWNCFPVSLENSEYSSESIEGIWKSENSKAQPDDALAYMIYTSGSTGEPKGVLVEHRSVCNTLAWRSKCLPLTTRDRILMLLSHQFDAAIGIGWSALVQGATLVWPDIVSKQDPGLLLKLVKEKGITVLPTVPSLLRVLVEHPDFDSCTSLREVWTGGEPLPPELPAIIRSKLPVRVWNLYGPTEAAIEATANDVTEHSPRATMSIGWPIDGMDVFIVDSSLRLVPDCVPGEIAIAGPGLARGYYNDAELTNRRFVAHPMIPGEKIYLTGDLGRKLPDGRIEFMGRLDHQVKLRGYRIELGEIESVIQSHPQVDRAAVTLHTPTNGLAQLVAYVSVSQSPQQTSTDSAQSESDNEDVERASMVETEWLHEFLADRLPPYKRPSKIVVLSKLPLTSSGKIDRKRLPIPLRIRHQAESIRLPRNALEQRIRELWCRELSNDSFGVFQNFFEIGGNSLQAAIVATKLSSDLDVNVPTALLFDQASIAQVSRRLAKLYPDSIGHQFGSHVVEFYSDTEVLENSPENLNLHPLLAPLKPSGSRTPLFMVHPPGGIVLCYRELARHLPDAQPLWAIRSRGLHGAEQLPNTIAEMASDYLEAVHSIQPTGPYVLGGWSLGGLVAYDMARQLLQRGEQVKRLVFLDTTIPVGASDRVPEDEQVNAGAEYGIDLTLDQLAELSAEEQLPMLYSHAKKLGILSEESAPEVVERMLKDLQHLFGRHVKLSRDYRLEPIATELLLLRPQEVPNSLGELSEDRGWRHLTSNVRVRFVPGHHHSMVQAPHAKTLAIAIAEEIR